MRLILLSILCAGLAWGAACAAQASGDYNTAATWTSCGGTYPQAVDTVTIGSTHAVTCSGACVAATLTQSATANALTVANGGTLTVGASTAGQVITVGAGATLTIQTGGALVFGNQPVTGVTGMLVTGSGSQILISGTITLKANLQVTAGGKITLHGGAIVQSDPGGNTGTNGMYYLQGRGTTAPYALIESDATSWSNPVTFRTINGSGSNSLRLDASGGYTVQLHLNYAVFTSCGDTGNCIYNFSDTTLTNVLMSGSGGLRWAASADTPAEKNTLALTNFHMRNILGPASLAMYSPGGSAKGSNPRHCTNCSFWTTAAGFAGMLLTLQIEDMTFTNPIFGSKVSLTGAKRVRIVNPFFINDGNIGANQRMLFVANSDQRITGGANIDNSTYLNPHTFYDTTSANTDGPNIVDGFVFHGYATSSAAQQWSSGGPHIVRNSIFLPGTALMDNTVYSALQRVIYTHNTYHQTSSSASISGFRSESLPGPYKFAAINNSIFSAMSAVLIYGGSWTGQAVHTCTVDTATPVAISSGTLTVPTSGSCSMTTSDGVTFQGLAAATWLNGKTVYVTSVTGAPPNVTSFTADLGKTPVTGAPASYSANDTAGSAFGGFYYDDNVFYAPAATGSVPTTRIWNRTTSASSGVWTQAPLAGATRTTFTSSGSVNPCSTINTAGTVGTTAVGDYVYNGTTYSALGIVSAVNSAQQIVVSWNSADGSAGLGNGRCADGSTMTVLYNYWESGIVGDVGKGSKEWAYNPRWIAPTRNPLTWDAEVLGGPGTPEHAAAQVLGYSGFDASGNQVTPNPLATIENYMAYIRRGFMPTNLALKRAGPDREDLGAVPILIYNAPGITGGGVY